jgi:hypothetical protein
MIDIRTATSVGVRPRQFLGLRVKFLFSLKISSSLSGGSVGNWLRDALKRSRRNCKSVSRLKRVIVRRGLRRTGAKTAIFGAEDDIVV